MGSVILGKLVLRWCNSCNLPALGKSCSICDSHTDMVKHTPPGDIRPAFPHDLQRMRNQIDTQFGEGCGVRLIPLDVVVILNDIPDQDRMDEVIVGGTVIGNYRYTIEQGYRFLLKPEGALRLLPTLTRSWAKCDDEAIPFIKKGRSVLSPGISDADPLIAPGDEVVVISESGELIGVGTSKMTGSDLKDLEYGLGIRLRQKWKNVQLPATYDLAGTWEDAVSASLLKLQNLESQAIGFIRKVIRQYSDIPAMVSLSGGKDSLVVLLLVLEAEIKPTLLFLNTGLEFPETIENVHRTAAEYDLPLVIADAGTAFWDHLPKFGPPAKDFRWCCKVCKLGPTARTIAETYPEGVLSFIGQRAYESSQRAKKSRVWVNPWVPGQIGASPIQNWTALHIWLYLFWKKADHNKLYELGFSRIGCWVCPASDQSEYLDILNVHPDGERWEDFLAEYAREKGFTDDWLDHGLWRWKRPPAFVKDLIDQKGLNLRRVNDDSESPEELVAEKFTFYMGDIRPSCTDDLTTEGVFNRSFDLERSSRLLAIFGLTVYDEETNVASIGRTLTATGEGSLTVNAPTKKEIENHLTTALEIIIRSEECVGCGICIGRCDQEALFLNNDGKVDIFPKLCVHCRKCLGKCPVTDFRDDGDFDN
jgi:phosphoadenosine phosphosulfate reductase